MAALEAIPSPGRPVDDPFRMPIRRLVSVRGIGSVVTGVVVSGAVAVRDRVVIVPYPNTGAAEAEPGPAPDRGRR